MCRDFLVLICFVPAILGALKSRSEETQDTSFHAKDVNNEVDVKFAPKFRHPSRMHNITITKSGSSVRFRCAAEGNPRPNITWTKNGGPIVRSYYQPSYGRWSLILDELTSNDNGNYTCVVCNELDCINHTYELKVQERFYKAPVLIEDVQNVTASWDETVRFSCGFRSELHAAIYWTKRSQNGTEELAIVSENVNDEPEKLTIYNVTSNSEGWYKCIAENTLGNATSQGYLKVINNNKLEEEHVTGPTAVTEILEISTQNTSC